MKKTQTENEREWHIHCVKSNTKVLLTMDEFVLSILEYEAKEFKAAVKEYADFLSLKPKRTDFINFDEDGFWLSDNEPLFKDFVTADDVSSDDNKVAYKDRTYIMFLKDEKKDVVIQNDQFITDECTYNEVAIAFNKKNGLEPLEFA